MLLKGYTWLCLALALSFLVSSSLQIHNKVAVTDQVGHSCPGACCGHLVLYRGEPRCLGPCCHYNPPTQVTNEGMEVYKISKIDKINFLFHQRRREIRSKMKARKTKPTLRK
ncbi:hypothetical protein Ancab_010743 [Ancistrocladus abbreviatus]